jgi:hypothetical protein
VINLSSSRRAQALWGLVALVVIAAVAAVLIVVFVGKAKQSELIAGSGVSLTYRPYPDAGLNPAQIAASNNGALVVFTGFGPGGEETPFVLRPINLGGQPVGNPPIVVSSYGSDHPQIYSTTSVAEWASLRSVSNDRFMGLLRLSGRYGMGVWDTSGHLIARTRTVPACSDFLTCDAGMDRDPQNHRVVFASTECTNDRHTNCRLTVETAYPSGATGPPLKLDLAQPRRCPSYANENLDAITVEPKTGRALIQTGCDWIITKPVLAQNSAQKGVSERLDYVGKIPGPTEFDTGSMIAGNGRFAYRIRKFAGQNYVSAYLIQVDANNPQRVLAKTQIPKLTEIAMRPNGQIGVLWLVGQAANKQVVGAVINSTGVMSPPQNLSIKPEFVGDRLLMTDAPNGFLVLSAKAKQLSGLRSSWTSAVLPWRP